MIKRFIGLFAVFILGLLGSACAAEEDQNQEASEESPLHIYTTLFAWEDFANRIGGEEVKVENLVPAGADAHSFEPTSQTMIDIAESDAFLFNGAGMEGFADSVNETVAAEDGLSVEVTKGLDLQDGLGADPHDHGEEQHTHEHGDTDPHVWLDPILAQQAAENIKDALIELRPQKEEIFEENFAELEEDLQSLDASFTEMAEKAEHKTFIVSHAAYGYWEARYGLEQMSISGISPSDEPSQKELQSIIETIEETGIQHVMFEQNVSSKVTDVVQNEADAEALYLHNVSTRSEEEIEEGADYFSLMKENIENLQTALQYSNGIEEEENHDQGEEEHEEHHGEEEHNHD
ncbi:metal ABC transporter solute-binding protein, Zn/Mn family [Salibacterium aidingense]|uniref:metal ABC transporter solute-binding protein, Zn/Mn family n=1 Tax=Salibacterium aidingense TaxID=384933 RepID=UPI003BD86949